MGQHDCQRLVAGESDGGEAGDHSSGISSDFPADELVGTLNVPEQTRAGEQAGIGRGNQYDQRHLNHGQQTAALHDIGQRAGLIQPIASSNIFQKLRRTHLLNIHRNGHSGQTAESHGYLDVDSQGRQRQNQERRRQRHRIEVERLRDGGDDGIVLADQRISQREISIAGTCRQEWQDRAL